MRRPVPAKRESDGQRPDGAQPQRAMRKRAAWSAHPSPSPGPPPPPAPRELLFDELASALIERAEGLLRGDRRADLVVVPRVLRLGRLLDLDEVSGVNLADVTANSQLAEERVVGCHLLHMFAIRCG